MDTSRRNLQQLCRAAESNAEFNPKIRHILDNVGKAVEENFCFMNGCGESEHRAALYYFLTSHHITDQFIRTFLNQTRYDINWFVEKQRKLQNNTTQSVTSRKTTSSQLVRGISALHVTIYRNSLHAEKIARLLLNWGRLPKDHEDSSRQVHKLSLASIPMTCGSYPLHILAGQNLTIREDTLKTVLNADPSIAFKDDVNGDNPISLLWKNILRFRWAISIMEGATCIDYIKRDDCSWMTVITPHQFIKFSLLMAVGAQGEGDYTEGSENLKINSIHRLCRIPRCPPMLLRLLQLPSYNARFGMSGNAFTSDRNGMLPIHHAVQTLPVTYRFVPSFLKRKHQRSIVGLLLEENPSGARVADDQGRLPLHYALHSGCLAEKDLLALVKLYPESLRMKDPQTGLLPFMLVAAEPRSLVTPMNNSLESSSISVESVNLEKEKFFGTERYQAAWKIDHVRMSFLLLSLSPDAIQSKPSSLVHL